VKVFLTANKFDKNNLPLPFLLEPLVRHQLSQNATSANRLIKRAILAANLFIFCTDYSFSRWVFW
jgi:hypothetical protein